MLAVPNRAFPHKGIRTAFRAIQRGEQDSHQVNFKDSYGGRGRQAG